MARLARIWAYVLVVSTAALGVFGYSLVDLTPQGLLWGLVGAIVNVLVELYPLNINDDGDLTLGGAVDITLLLVFGLAPALISIVAGEVAYTLIKRRPVVKSLFNGGQTVLSATAGYWIFVGSGGTPGQLSAHAFAMALTYTMVNTLAVSSILSLAQGQPFWSTWVGLNRNTLAYSIILGVSGMAFAGLVITYGWLGLLLVVILMLCLQAVLTQASLSVRNMKKRLVQTIRVLTSALEHRDPCTLGHSARVSELCRKTAIEMGLSPIEVERIELGGLLHDVGKVGVPDVVLNKPGRLTAEEYKQIKTHTLIGEQILLGIEGTEPLANMAREHHLFYDGSERGYPDRRASRDAYIGSRILSVADAWDAMTADRPYRQALLFSQALAQLYENRGVQFDPEVVDAFLRVLEAEGVLAIAHDQQIRQSAGAD